MRQGRGDERAARKREAEGFGEHLPGAGAAHELTRATGGAGAVLVQFQFVVLHLAALHCRAHAPHIVARDGVRRVHLCATGQVNGREIAPGHRHQVRGHAFIIAADDHHAVVRVPEGVNLDHRRLNIPRDERITHARVRLRYAIADIRGVEHARLAPRLEHAIGDFLDQRAEVKGAGMAHSICALHEDLWLAEVFFCPYTIICAIGELCLLFCGQSIGMLWTGNIMVGFGISAIWPAQFAFFDDLFNFNNSVGVVFIAFAGIANSITPCVIGERIEEMPMVLIYIGLAGLAIAAMIFAIINGIVFVIEKKRKDSKLEVKNQVQGIENNNFIVDNNDHYYYCDTNKTITKL